MTGDRWVVIRAHYGTNRACSLRIAGFSSDSFVRHGLPLWDLAHDVANQKVFAVFCFRLERARRAGTEDSTGRAGVSFEMRVAVLTLWVAIGPWRRYRAVPAWTQTEHCGHRPAAPPDAIRRE